MRGRDDQANWCQELKTGAWDITPLAIGVAIYGLAFGLLGSMVNMTSTQIGTMGALVFAGSSQIIAIERLAAGASVATAIVAGLALNLRIFLITATLRQEMDRKPWWQKLIGLHLATDENWALMHATRNKGNQAGYWYFVGGGLCLLLVWIVSTVIGLNAATAVPDPQSLGMDFAFAAAFIAISRSLWRGAHDFLPWVTAVGSSVVLVLITPLDPSWAIALSGALGAVVAGLIYKPDVETTQ